MICGLWGIKPPYMGKYAIHIPANHLHLPAAYLLPIVRMFIG